MHNLLTLLKKVKQFEHMKKNFFTAYHTYFFMSSCEISEKHTQRWMVVSFFHSFRSMCMPMIILLFIYHSQWVNRSLFCILKRMFTAVAYTLIVLFWMFNRCQTNTFLNQQQESDPSFYCFVRCQWNKRTFGGNGGRPEKVCEFMDEPTRDSMIKM